MARRTAGTLTVEEALTRLQDIQTDESDENSDIDLLGDETDVASSEAETSSSPASDSDDDDDYSPQKKRPRRGAIHECALPAVAEDRNSGCDSDGSIESGTETEYVDNGDQQLAGTAFFRGKDGTPWHKTVTGAGRANAANVVHMPNSLPLQSRRVKTCLDAFLLFFDPAMLRRIISCTELEAKRVKGEDFDLLLSESEFLAYIGLLIARGVLRAKNEPLNALFSETYGRGIFRDTMTRKRFKEIHQFLRFDEKASRPARRMNDKFCLLREIWDRFVMHCRANYHPSAMLTVDEQLFTTKSRCPFTQFMPSKPGKFGIKFWVLADAEKPYILNIKPYLGRNFDEERGGLQLGESVVMSLMQPFLGRGYNVTTDNFFTSLRLAKQLAAKKTTLLGTVRANRRELPAEFISKNRPLHSVLQGYNIENQCHLLSSKVKKTKIVNVMSTMTRLEGNVVQDGSKKPEAILIYNKTKFGVDRIDQMARLYSTKPGCRRWPLQVFCNMLDIGSINAHTVYKMSSKSRKSRRMFLLSLAEELVASHRAERKESTSSTDAVSSTANRRKCRKCQKNMASKSCHKCQKPVCGKCSYSIKLCC